MSRIIRKDISDFRKNTFIGFMGTVLEAAKKLEGYGINPVVAAFENAYSSMSDAINLDKIAVLTAKSRDLASQADSAFETLNNHVKAIVLLDVDGCGATAKAVRDIIVKFGYAPAMSQNARFVTIQLILDYVAKVDGASALGYGVSDALAELKELSEQFDSVQFELKALRDASRAKFESCRRQLTKAYTNLVSYVEIMIEVADSESLEKFKVQVNETLIRIYVGKAKDDDAEAAQVEAETMTDEVQADELSATDSSEIDA